MRRPAPLAFTLLALAVSCGDNGGSPSSDAASAPLVFGGSRPTNLQVPAGFDASKQYPLVVILHGYGATGSLQEAFFGAGALVSSGQAFVIAPDGLVDGSGNQYWNADPACCDFDHANPDDVGFIGGLIDDVSAAWPIDPGAVTLLGHSNGGFMAYKMACARADVVTNIEVLAGAAASDPTTCTPSRAVEVLHMHGTIDNEVPYDVAVPSVEQWATHDACGSAMTAGSDLDLDTTLPGAETTTATIDGCPTGITVELWSITGASHIPTLAADFSTTMLDYSAAHRRP
ncbi:MAG TPA: alpha/beta hydrolase-fold protein [Acidimicrobiia bacterium]|jgi:polyhydroxybutyrate depolymerase|nr:alpha/beta hydrolase-fold protein [Acidimicrobiia bacterium]